MGRGDTSDTKKRKKKLKQKKKKEGVEDTHENKVKNETWRREGTSALSTATKSGENNQLNSVVFKDLTAGTQIKNNRARSIGLTSSGKPWEERKSGTGE